MARENTGAAGGYNPRSCVYPVCLQRRSDARQRGRRPGCSYFVARAPTADDRKCTDYYDAAAPMSGANSRFERPRCAAAASGVNIFPARNDQGAHNTPPLASAARTASFST